MLRIDFPRELCVDGTRVAIANNVEDMRHFIDKFNKRHNLYTSVYSFRQTAQNKGVYATANITRVFFDFDTHAIFDGTSIPVDAYLNLIKFYIFMKAYGIAFSVNFSGRGFHAYVYVNENDTLNNPNKAVYNFQSFIKKRLDLEIDLSSFGDVARETRIINTMNMRSHRYCIPLTDDDILRGQDFIERKALARVPLEPAHMLGSTLVSLKPFDSGVSMSNGRHDRIDIYKTTNSVHYSHFIKHYGDIPCVENVLTTKEPGWPARTFILTFMMGKGYSINDAQEIMKSFISEHKWSESSCTREHAGEVYARGYFIPSCATLAEKGICPLAGKQHSCRYFNRLLDV